MATMLEVLNGASGRSAATSDKFPNHVLTGRYASGFTNSLMAKDVDLYLRAVEEQRRPGGDRGGHRCGVGALRGRRTGRRLHPHLSLRRGIVTTEGGAPMTVLTTEKLGATVGAQVLGVDRDRLLDDDAFPEWCLQVLDENGALVFRDLHLDDETQVAFSRKLGRVEAGGQGRPPGDLPGDARPGQEPGRPSTCGERSTGTSTAPPTTSRSWPRC